jgi:hypothetical protein
MRAALIIPGVAMRIALLALLVLVPALSFAATTGPDDQFAQLVRKPTNTVCPFDGNPTDARLQPVPILGADGQEVLVGTCTQSCNDSLHLKSFGDEGRSIAAAAKSNTTIDRLPKTATGPGKAPATGIQTAPPFGAATPPPFGQPVTPGKSSDVADHAASEPKSHAPSKPRANSNDPDERQRAKKAAQRRDRGSSTRAKAGAKDSDEETDRKVK